MRGSLVLFFSVPFLACCSSNPKAAPDSQVAPAVVVQCPAGEATTDLNSPRLNTPAMSAEAVKTCLGEGSKTGSCLNQLFRGFMSNHTTGEALALLQCYEDTDDAVRLSCHPVVHAIGRETFLAKGTIDGSFALCDQTCHSGCYHGVMERFFGGDAADTGSHISLVDLQRKAVTACDPMQTSRIRFQCLHGLGHAVTYYSGYDLKEALKICDATGDAWTRSSCYGGVFMENISAAEPESRDLSATDFHYPCSVLDDMYKGSCYLMQTSRMADMGLTPFQIVSECRKAGTYLLTCMQSLGRDLSNSARIGKPREVAATCEMGLGEELSACTRGVVFALEDNTWDGKFALPFCATYASPENVKYCFQASLAYLASGYSKTKDDLKAECAKYAPASPECVAGIVP